MSGANEPIEPHELEGLLARFLGPGHRAALAVSGGSDSTALMVLAADWLAMAGSPAAPLTVLTVDHGLRPESATEARSVGRQAEALGFRHEILRWDGPKPDAGVQAAARAARYRLMADHMRAHGLNMLLTAHTADDQAETLLMRLARGSGLDGLSAMAPTSLLDPGSAGEPVHIARPLLGLAKGRLVATLQRRGIAWSEDPSNEALVFERARLRAARPQLAALGLTGDMLALSARRLQRVRAALEETVDRFCQHETGRVVVDPCGFIVIDRASLRDAPEEIATRVLLRAIGAAGGSAAPVSLAGVEAIAQALREHGEEGAWTLARASVAATPQRILIEREPGRDSLPALALSPSTRTLWDGRYRVETGAELAGGLCLSALADAGTRALRRAEVPVRGIPRRALLALPGVWEGERLLAVPPLGYWADDSVRRHLSVAFAGLDRYNR